MTASTACRQTIGAGLRVNSFIGFSEVALQGGAHLGGELLPGDVGAEAEGVRESLDQATWTTIKKSDCGACHVDAEGGTFEPGSIHIGIGRRWAGTKVLILARDLELRIITQDGGELIRELTLDPTRNYQAQAPRM